MNEFEDINRELEAAFAERPSTLSRPSLGDVQRRARRHQRQRSAGILSACALVGVGGVAVLATRSPSNTTTVGEGLDPTESTVCFSNPPTSLPAATTTSLGISAYGTAHYVVQAGDNPTSIANTYGITLQELNAANAETPGYDLFAVGLIIAIPLRYPFIDTTVPFNTLPPYTGPATTTTVGLISDPTTYTTIELPSNTDSQGTSTTLPGITVLGATTTTDFAGPPTTFIVNDTTDCFSASESTTTTPATTTSVDSTTPLESLPELSKVGTSVQVFNCSNQEGVARLMTDALIAEGFTMGEVDTGTIDLPVTKVIYNPDDPAALAVAETVASYLGNAVVEASGPVVPGLTTGTWAPGSSVIVLLGDDLAGKSLAQIAGGTTSATTTTYSP